MANHSFPEVPGKKRKKEKDQQTVEAQDAQENAPTTEQLLPALLQLNIRQARADGESDLAQALQSLQFSLQAKTDSEPSDPEEPI